MNTLKLNSAGLNRVTLNTIGEVRFKSRGGEPKPPSYENGVYIQHIDGKLYTTDEWTAKAFANDEANGVAVVADECRFVMAKADKNTNNWSSDTTTEVVGVLMTEDEEIAKTDFNGKSNTEKIAAVSTSGAAKACANYVFPRGNVGYLPALGEMVVAYSHRTEVNNALSVLGNSMETASAYWTSVQKTASTAWQIKWSSGDISANAKTKIRPTRPFTELK